MFLKMLISINQLQIIIFSNEKNQPALCNIFSPDYIFQHGSLFDLFKLEVAALDLKLNNKVQVRLKDFTKIYFVCNLIWNSVIIDYTLWYSVISHKQ